MNDTCQECALGENHYHCAKCGKSCGMQGHYQASTESFYCQTLAARIAGVKHELLQEGTNKERLEVALLILVAAVTLKGNNFVGWVE